MGLAHTRSLEEEQGGLVTDRPDFTESSFTILPGRLQIESGFTQEWTASSSRSFSAPELLLRIGMAKNLEARFGLPNYGWAREGALSEEGFGATYLGFKLQLGPLGGGWDSALIPAITFPARSGSESTTPELKAVWATAVGAYSLTGMTAASWPEAGAMEWLQTVSLGIPIASRLGAFVEGVAGVSRSSRPAYTLHGGFVYQPDRSTQWDFHIGAGLSPAAPRVFLGAGYSIGF